MRAFLVHRLRNVGELIGAPIGSHPDGVGLATVVALDLFRNLFDRLTSLTRRSKSVGEQSVGDFQCRIAALRVAASRHPTKRLTLDDSAP